MSMVGRWTVAAFGAVFCAAVSGCGGKDDDKTVKLYAGAGLRRAVDELAAAFQEETGIPVEPDYGGSGVQIGRVKMGAEADLFMPGDVGYVDTVADLIEERATVSWFVPVIVVAKRNPKGVKGLADFLDPDKKLKVALGNPKACRVGQISDELFAKNGLDWEKIPADRLKLSTTVNELGLWVKVGDVDASIVWDAIAHNIADSTDRVEIPADKNVISHVVVGLLKSSRNKEAARKFLKFILGPKGQAILKKNGYRTEAP